MIAYVDSSVLLRLVLGEPQPLREWSRLETTVSSTLLRVECLRTLDRARIRFRAPDEEIAIKRADVLRRLESFHLIPVDEGVLERAAQPLPTLLGTLDAIHLACATLAQPRFGELAFATHDDQLGVAARACGFDVIGC